MVLFVMLLFLLFVVAGCSAVVTLAPHSDGEVVLMVVGCCWRCWRAWEVGKVENIFENKSSRNYPNDYDHHTKAFSKPKYPSQSHENK